MKKKEQVRVLFVCLGNICRSPAAEGVLKHFVEKDNDLNIYVESCGIGRWHVGCSPDTRMQQASKARGLVLASKAQQFQLSFFDHFDYILVVDKEIKNYLYNYAETAEQKAKILLVTEFSSIYKGEDIPDPYYQGEAGFELVLDMLYDACEGFIKHLRENKEPPLSQLS